MKYSIAAAAALLLATVQAAPLTARQQEVHYITATFYGAADAQYTLQIPDNGQAVIINNPLSVSRISTSPQIGTYCLFEGTEQGQAHSEVRTTPSGGIHDVGPPQPQASGSCVRFSS